MIKPSPFEIRSELTQNTARLTVIGELDIATVPRLQEEVHALLERAGEHTATIRRLVIDLSQLTFIDSSGLSFLIALNDRATAEGWTLNLTRPSEPSVSIFHITGADKNLPFIEEERSP
jgi:anti-sigma B factor antagonist